jgi:hypothetical protein
MISHEIFKSMCKTPAPQNVWNKIKIGMGFFTGRTFHIEINGDFACAGCVLFFHYQDFYF